MNASDDATLRILFVCTANRCRSPLAEVIARDAIERRGADATVTSAGLLVGGRHAASGSQQVASQLGLDLSSHLSRQVSASIIEQSDVVVTMEADHVLDLVSISPSSRERALTLRELATNRRTEDHHMRPLDRRVVRERVRLAASRPLEELLSGGHDIDDPMGRSPRAFRRTADELADLLDVVFDDWFGPGPPSARIRRRGFGRGRAPG